MKTKLLTVCLFVVTFSLQAQVAINTDNSSPDASAMLDLKSIDKGMLVPRMTSVQRIAITSPATSLLVFDTDTNSFWFYNASAWENLSNSSAGANILADADNNTLIQVEESPNENIIRFDLDGTERWVMKNTRIEPVNSGNSIFIGEEAGLNDDLSDNNNIGVGKKALYSNTTGSNNIATGALTLFSNTAGYNNIANGYAALYSNTTGNFNTANGAYALFGNTIGSNNVANGYGTLEYNTEGIFPISLEALM